MTDSSATTLENYTYDQTGDRLSKTVNGTAQSYAYASPLTSHRLQSVAGTARSYDANGNTNAIGTAAFTYDDRNRLASAGGVSYGYNGRGERVTKDSTTLTDANARYAYSTNGQLLAEYQYGTVCVPRPHMSGCTPAPGWLPKTEYLWLDGTLVGVAQNGTPFLGTGTDPTPAQLYYVETDPLGTPRVVVQPGDVTMDDVVVWTWDYFGSAFGENAPDQDPDGDSTDFVFNLRYPGQYFDAETNLNYNYFRDYEPGTGRYVESDPIGLKGGISTYSYVAGRPLIATDPDGLAIWICGRAAFGGWLGNHAYLWDDKKKRCCGMNHGHDPLASCKEKGPPSDTCVLVGNSDGKEDGIINCCQKTGNDGVWPIRDCHDAANDCITKAGLSNPGTTGGRFGSCSSCWIKPPPAMPQGSPEMPPLL